MNLKKKYSDKFILDKVHQHCVVELKSVHTLSNPCYNTIRNRCRESSEFNSKIQNIVALANARWEEIGINALLNNDPNFALGIFKLYTSNKKPWASYQDLELESRVSDLEERQNVPQA